MIVLNVGHHAWSTGELQVFVSPHCVNIDKTLLRHLTIYVTDIYTAIRVGLLNTSPQQHTRSITVSRIKLIRCRRNDNDACSSRNNRFNVRHQWHRRLTSQGDSGGAASVCVCVWHGFITGIEPYDVISCGSCSSVHCFLIYRHGASAIIGLVLPLKLIK